MSFKPFVTPHCHVNSLDSASTPKAFIKKELELGTGAITVTDHGTLQACRTVYDLAKKNGLVPIIGIEGYLRDDNCPILKAAGIEQRHPLKKNRREEDTSKPKGFQHYAKYFHFTAHAMDQSAYECMIRLVSKAPLEKHGTESKPIMTWADLEELGGYNVTFSSGCLIGVVSRHLLAHDNPELAIKYYEKFRSLVKPGNFYVEVFPHVCDRKREEGVFLTVNTGDGMREQQFHEKKKLMTNEGEIEALELVKVFEKPDNKHEFLKGVKHYQTWEEHEPVKIHKAEKREGWILNECRPWAPNADFQQGCNEFVLGLAKKYGDKVLCSDDSHFVDKSAHEVQTIRLQQTGNWQLYNSYHRFSSSEAYEYFSSRMNIPPAQFEEWVENSHEFRDKFKDFSLNYEISLPSKFYPDNTTEHLHKLLKKHGRMPYGNGKYVERLREEIRLFRDNGIVDMLPYFFLAEEVCSVYRDAGLLTGPGRGSAAGSLLAYLFGITHIDPIKYNLSLARFLTLDRIKSGAMPDIDLDFPSRDILVEGEDAWLPKRFGNHFAQISTESLLRLKSSARDVARAKFGQVPYEIDKLIRKFEDAPQGVSDKDFIFGYEDSGNFVQGSIERDQALITYRKRYPDQFEVVTKTLALCRSRGRHPSAFLIANKPIESFIPTTTIGGYRCTAYTMGPVEANGGIKMDFLVLKSLDDLSKAIKLIQKRSGQEIPENPKINGRLVPSMRVVPHKGKLLDIWDLPADKEVFNDIVKGKTETVFQFNTPSCLKWMGFFDGSKPDGTPLISKLEDLATFTALDRPGPLDAYVKGPSDSKDGPGHNILVEYALRAKGEAASEDLPEILMQLIPETYGLPVFQEQVQYIYKTLMDCSLAEAEEFRRNIGKKKVEKILAVYPLFIEKAGAKIGTKNAEAVWQCLKSFSNYGFCLAHATAYGAIGYACAFLKHHYPFEWWAAVLSNATKDEVNAVFWKYAGHMIDLPDLTKKSEKFEIFGDRIQAPTSLLFGIGEAAHKELTDGAPYRDIKDFCKHIRNIREKGATTKAVRIEKKKRKTNKVTKQVEITTVVMNATEKVLGRTALTSRVINTLIISGAMDKLFPPGVSVPEMLKIYAETMEEVNSVADGKPNKHKAEVDERYINLGALDRFLMRKEVLPAYSEPLLPMLTSYKHENLVTENGRLFVKIDNEQALVVPYKEFKDKEFRNGHCYTLALVGYVEDVRDFCYGQQKEKEARALIVDIDEERHEFVKWPGKYNKLPSYFKALDLKGSVVGMVFSRYRSDRDFALSGVAVLKSAIVSEKDEEKKEGEDESTEAA